MYFTQAESDMVWLILLGSSSCDNMVSRCLCQVYPFISNHITTSYFHSNSTENWSYGLPNCKGRQEMQSRYCWTLPQQTCIFFYIRNGGHKKLWGKTNSRRNKSYTKNSEDSSEQMFTFDHQVERSSNNILSVDELSKHPEKTTDSTDTSLFEKQKNSGWHYYA